MNRMFLRKLPNLFRADNIYIYFDKNELFLPIEKKNENVFKIL